ncbi:conserved hypothetical protein [Pediculus humanus corporis]|uniref:Uncharacterized protein n=1 Tax=Pediculus humanus subsp. corporis TaxID=121224 RepID=E0V9D5_PEDHC|nr:uncharacterized protein Phum_PHUM009510 [Pediculus humanus corporis]EEB09991.1 conserved hypothetical protein [Pediculus humanus corporis]
MDKLTVISGALFVAADVFAVVSLVMPDWIVSDIGVILIAISYWDANIITYARWVGFTSMVLFCMAAIIFPMGFHIDEIGGQPYQLPNSHQVGLSYILFVMALWITVISELFAAKVCLPHF